MARALFLVALGVLGCGEGRARAPEPRLESRGAVAAAAVRCPVDVPALLRRHAQAFGSEASVAASLPRTLTGSVSGSAGEGWFESVIQPARARFLLGWGDGVLVARGVDGAGEWDFGPAGVIWQPAPRESQERHLETWLFERAYISAFLPARDDVICKDTPSGAEVDLRYQLPAVGVPRLRFDATSARLIAASRFTMSNEHVTTVWLKSSAPDARGVRWPEEWHDERGKWVVSSNTPGLRCGTRGPRWPGAVDCSARPPQTFALSGLSGAVVRVPVLAGGGHVSIAVRVDGRPLRAILDSGAALSVIDPLSSTKRGFRSRGVVVQVPAATQRVKVAMGETDVSLGPIELRDLPLASATLPSMMPAPDMILGLSLFLSAAVRIDYARREVGFASTADALRSPQARSVPIAVDESGFIVTAEINGGHGLMAIDTGSDAELSLFGRWASVNGLPGARPTVVERGRYGLGTHETERTFFRLEHASLGPIVAIDTDVTLDDPPSAGSFAGRIGNALLARCQAVTFDVAKRTLWLEPPCDRVAPESLVNAYCRLNDAESPAWPGTPWVVSGVVPRGTAERSGFRVGDRLLEIDARPAGRDLQFIEKFKGPYGTTFRAVVARDGERVELEVKLSDPFAR